jgi:riboflavin synthase
MFTGIIEELGRIVSATPLEGGSRLSVSSSFAGELQPDQSVAINGACQTVVRADDATFDVVAVEETLAKTTLGSLTAGDRVNLERAVRPDQRLDGHLVQGHVDATGTIEASDVLADSRLFRISYAPSFARYLIPVGSIAVDGMSLTVARLVDDVFTVSIIPHTYERTNVSTWEAGRRVNLEFDLIGKYVARWMDTRRT